MKVLKSLRQLGHWLWLVARKGTITAKNTSTGETWEESFTRTELWHIFRPVWVLNFGVVYKKCGCGKRFGLWPVMWCSAHVFAEAARKHGDA